MNPDDDLDVFLDAFLKKGESIPMERNGEESRLYRPIITLSRDEALLLADFEIAGERAGLDFVDRKDGIAFLEKVARKTVKDKALRAALVAKVTAYLDELYMTKAAGAVQ